MKTRFLFPHKWRMAGIILLLFSAVLMVVNYCLYGGIFAPTLLNFSFLNAPLANAIQMLDTDAIGVSIIVGLLLFGFSKEKIEDEQIAQIRLESLQWGIYLNYIVFILCIVLVNGMDFLGILVYNTITPLLIFISRFRWKQYQLNRLIKQAD